MNYVELHIGDYEKATSHLTACEDGIYGRLIRRYYDTEAPLPLDLKAIQRFVRARSRDEKEAVETVLEEFFIKTDDGWRHKRCDEEIARYGEKREKAKRSADARWNRSERNANAYTDGMRTHSEGNAHQSPVTSHQSSIGSTEASTHVAPGEITPAARACLLMRRAGCAHTNPSHSTLLAAIAEGVTPEALGDTAAEAIAAGKGKPFAWAIATARSRQADGASRVTSGPPRRTGSGTAPPMSKTLQALHELEAVKNGTGLDHSRDQLRLAEADPAQP
jgi:uncharacterized protein YdaU (DUF1376 family)